MWVWVGLLQVITAQSPPAPLTSPALPTDPNVSPGPTLPFPILGLGPSVPHTRRFIVRESPPVRGLGPRLAARIRTEGPLAPQRFVAHSMDAQAIRKAGGQVHAELGPLVAGTLMGQELVRLAPTARLVDAPATLRPALDVARNEVQGQRPDRGEGFERKYRGSGVLIAAYDTGLDLAHPDLRELDDKTRALAVWDQEREGTPPPGNTIGHLCDRATLIEDTCPHRDLDGHGTLVTSIAASGGPQYRGIAPNANLVIAASQQFELFLPTLQWFEQLAEEFERPMVVNLSLSGHEGPHDGTSLEAQAINILKHLVVVAAGNEGITPVHASTTLDSQEPRQVALLFPIIGERRDRRAIINIWADDGEIPLAARFRLLDPPGEIAETEAITVGDAGRTERLETVTTTLAVVQLDAEAAANTFNRQQHLRFELTLPEWEEDRWIPVIRLEGEGRVNLWVDTPPFELGLVRFADFPIENVADQLLGDTETTLSDLATATAALSVAAFVSRTRVTTEDGARRYASGSIGALAAFTSRGPALSSGPGSKKPDIAAPGSILVGALSRDSAGPDGQRVSDLYRISEGTSMATPLVAGAAAVLLGARPELTPAEVKDVILRGAHKPPDSDPRWGAGRLNVTQSLELALGHGCGCRGMTGTAQSDPRGIWWLMLIWVIGRRARL